MKALEGVKILDFTHVQSGPTCTQLLAWFGADVIKVERPGVGDATRKQLVDVEGADSLYFTMLNHNKRSLTLNTKNETGKEVLERLVKECDVLVENFAPGSVTAFVSGRFYLARLEDGGFLALSRTYMACFGRMTPEEAEPIWEEGRLKLEAQGLL